MRSRLAGLALALSLVGLAGCSGGPQPPYYRVIEWSGGTTYFGNDLSWFAQKSILQLGCIERGYVNPYFETIAVFEKGDAKRYTRTDELFWWYEPDCAHLKQDIDGRARAYRGD